MTKLETPNPHSAFRIPHSTIREWTFVTVLLLLTWGLRLRCLETVPPGWRDDELIESIALSGQVLAGHLPIYFTGASGHEPLYHYLHAGVNAVLGYNLMSGHLLSIAFGTLTVALTYALSRRLFGRTVASLASLALATSFWSLMYSRIGLRHVSAVAFALLVFYLLWHLLERPHPRRRAYLPVGLALGLGLHTYFASRLLPAILIVFALYLLLFHRADFRRHWQGLALALALAVVLVTPMALAIARSAGADARLAELAVPLRELQAGNPRPLLESIWTTLGMFRATGDPEWLYNIPDRPVFNVLGAALLWAGIALCLYRWRQPRYFFLLLWLGAGLLPAFVSIPPASLSHTILAQPVAYILPVLALAEVKTLIANCRSQIANRKPPFSNLHAPSFMLHSPLFIVHCSFFLLLTTNAIRDLRDYFLVWPRQDMVRYLYRADYREAAHYLNAHPEIADVAVSSALMGPWDRLALDVDTRREDVAVRLFNAERVLIWTAKDGPSLVLLTSYPPPPPTISDLLKASPDLPTAISPGLTLYTLPPISTLQSPIRIPQSAFRIPLARFANGLELIETRWMTEPPLAPGQEAVLLTTWHVPGPLDLPPLPIVPNPPPPGVYSGPRLAVFIHVSAGDGTFLTGDDGLWVDPLTLRPGDQFIQVHRFQIPPNAPDGPYTLELGLYDPMTGKRWVTVDAAREPGADRILLPVPYQGQES
jgi:hypothetical protein